MSWELPESFFNVLVVSEGPPSGWSWRGRVRVWFCHICDTYNVTLTLLTDETSMGQYLNDNLLLILDLQVKRKSAIVTKCASEISFCKCYEDTSEGGQEQDWLADTSKTDWWIRARLVGDTSKSDWLMRARLVDDTSETGWRYKRDWLAIRARLILASWLLRRLTCLDEGFKRLINWYVVCIDWKLMSFIFFISFMT